MTNAFPTSFLDNPLKAYVERELCPLNYRKSIAITSIAI